ncbi:MAG TPA: hypothetical protein VEL74_19610 [Thermoanaerobaculia bacterium]|nr:hypothetical protein [Thermoanaerobaculia bacterium]
MSISKSLCLLLALVLVSALGASGGWAQPGDVPELRFDEIFASPVGPGGLEYSAKARGLAGRRVRVAGYMVRRDAAPPGTFLLTPVPVQLHEAEYGLADDLPAATLLVEAPAWRGRPMPHEPGPLMVTGVLQLGNREEPDGRVSSVRLVLDGPDTPSDPTLRSTEPKEGTP